MLKRVLNSPRIYQAFQEAGGFFGARLKGINEFVDIRPGMTIVDIGCGPGYIVRHLPKGVNYIGYDIDEGYISHAKAVFGDRGTFYCRFFDKDAARAHAPADIVMMNGVLHHVPDEELLATLANVYDVLAVGGKLFTLDGCYRTGQSSFRKWMLDNDRGEYVRDEAGYRRILSNSFQSVELHLRESYSRVPYTYVIGISTKRPD